MSREITWTDPFDDMTDEELDEYVDWLYSRRRRAMMTVLGIGRAVAKRAARLFSRSR